MRLEVPHQAAGAQVRRAGPGARRDPDGLPLALVARGRAPMRARPGPRRRSAPSIAVRGFHGVTLTLDDRRRYRRRS